MRVDLTQLVKLDRRLRRASFWMKVLAVFVWLLMLVMFLLAAWL